MGSPRGVHALDLGELPATYDRFVGWAPKWLTEKVPRDHWESEAAFRRRRRVTAVTSVAGASLLGASLSTKPDSTEFYGLTFGVAATWIAGGLASGPLHLGWQETRHHDRLERPVVMPIVLGVGAFGAFYAAALVAREVPVLDRALRDILQFAGEGSFPLVLATTLANGAAEEVFFRGALYASAAADPVIKSTAVYTVATAATRNPALVLAASTMGTLFALQRRATGGIQAPLLTHLTWSTLMARFLPPLFTGPHQGRRARRRSS